MLCLPPAQIICPCPRSPSVPKSWIGHRFGDFLKYDEHLEHLIKRGDVPYLPSHAVTMPEHNDETTFRDGAGYIDDFRASEAAPPDDIVQRAVELHNMTLEEDAPEEEPAADDSELSELDELSEEHEDGEGFDVGDEDWEVADGDFTKQYNKLRTEGAIRSAIIEGKASSGPSAPLPARNFARSRTATSGSSNKLNLAPRPAAAPAAVVNVSGVASAPKHSSRDANQKDKADRATVEQVLDPRTRKVLMSLIRKGLVSGVEGCVSTGKEANVYFGTPPETRPVSTSGSADYPDPYPKALALKIYKTSILSFKARGQYIQGEHRFRNSYSKVTNPRKMVRVWAEKELRNLRRLWEGGVRSPAVVEVRENVLVMEFLGTGDSTSPRLKDADIPANQLADLYAELLVAMRRMFHRCRLIHADLSEYNILYHDSHLYIIDVSQSVEHDHPSAFDFLRADIRNVDEFFRKRSGGEVRTLGGKGTFDFVVSERLKVWEGDAQVDVEDTSSEEGLFEVIRNWLAHGVGHEVQTSSATTIDAEEQSQQASDRVFMSSYIPRNLGEVYDPERDIEIIASGKGGDLIYAGLTGLKTESKSVPVEEEEAKDVRPEGGSDDDSNGTSDEEDTTKPRGFRHEDKEAKKVRHSIICLR